MSVRVLQSCDMCGTTREIRASSIDAKKHAGWRSLPVETRYGECREEQPFLCPLCLGRVAAWIKEQRTEALDSG